MHISTVCGLEQYCSTRKYWYTVGYILHEQYMHSHSALYLYGNGTGT